MKNYIITEQLANALLKYLGNRPYVEVASLIQELTKLEASQGERPSDGD